MVLTSNQISTTFKTMRNLVETLENEIIAVEFFMLYNPSGLYDQDGNRTPERYQEDWVTSGTMYSEEEGGELKPIESLVEGHQHFYDEEGQLQDPSIMKIIGEISEDLECYFWQEDEDLKYIVFPKSHIFEKYALYGTFSEEGELLQEMEADREWNFPVFDCFGQKFHACDLCEHSERFVIVDGTEYNIENLEKVI